MDAIEEFANGDGPSEYVKVCKVANEAEIWSLQSPNMHQQHYYAHILSHTVYHKMESTKQFSHVSKRQKIIESKLPVAVARYHLLFCSLVRKETEKYQISFFTNKFKDSLHYATD